MGHERDVILSVDSFPEIQPDEHFCFRCHPGIACFNVCCHDLDLVLSPYDVLLLRRKLGASGSQFAQDYAMTLSLPGSGFPVLQLCMRNDDGQSCPFLATAGCSVYDHRPAACRMYPLGRGTRLDERQRVVEKLVVVREDHCLGFSTEQEWTPRTWMADQGLAPHLTADDRFLRLLASTEAQGIRLKPKQAEMFMLALYRLDDFGRLVDQLQLLELQQIPAAQRQEINTDEVARLHFAFTWLEGLLRSYASGRSSERA